MSGLKLKTSLCFEDFANHLGLLLWDTLGREMEDHRLDPHRFPDLSKTMNRVLLRRVDACPVSADPRSCDIRGIPERHVTIPVTCPHHTEHLLKELGTEIRVLIDELENEIMEFVSRQSPERAQYKSLKESVHRVTEAVLPCLYENMACSSCAGT